MAPRQPPGPPPSHLRRRDLECLATTAALRPPGPPPPSLDDLPATPPRATGATTAAGRQRPDAGVIATPRLLPTPKWAFALLAPMAQGIFARPAPYAKANPAAPRYLPVTLFGS